MRSKFNIEMSICQAENGFSLDELVKKLSDAFENKAFSEILKMNLQLTQEVLMHRIFNNSCCLHCCADGHLMLNGSFKRRIRTSLGEFKMDFWRVRCSKCGKTFAPLAKFIGLKRYQTKTNELEKLVIEAVSGTNYRRAIKDLEQAGKFPVSFQTAHGWVMRSDCDEIKIPSQTIGSIPLQIMPDGTGFKGPGLNGQAQKGDLKVVIGISQQGNIFPLASKAGATWKDITDEWDRNKIKFKDGSILICDGELGLAEAFADYATEQQRCHWHIKRDLYHMMYQDGGRLKESKPIQDALAGVLAIELPQDDFQKVSEQEKSDIEERMEKAELAIDKLIGYFDGCGYNTAATYIRRAKIGMFGYIRRWLKWGLLSPRASSMVERVMRELGRRLKKIAYGWSDNGATKIARIILKRFTNIRDWEDYWQQKMNINSNVVVLFDNIKCTSCNI